MLLQNTYKILTPGFRMVRAGMAALRGVLRRIQE
jgi:hypothetical protein